MPHEAETMRILGIDPGTATIGYGLIDSENGTLSLVSYGVIRTSADTPMPLRLLDIHTDLCALITQFKPDYAAVEDLFFGKNVTTAISVGQARGVILLSLAQAGIPLAEYSPPKVKSMVAGYGNANKTQMQLMVCHLLGLEDAPHPDDAADALAVAITYYYDHKTQLIVSD